MAWRGPCAAKPQIAYLGNRHGTRPGGLRVRRGLVPRSKGEEKLEMEKSLLAQLREMTIVVADTGDIEAIEKFKPQDATTNPSLITTAAQMPQYSQIVDDVLLEAKKELGPNAKNEQVTKLAFERLAVAFGKKILGIIKGRVSTEVDARLSYDTEKTMATARSIISQYEKAGISRERVLIKIASTWAGIRAAEQLEKEGIHCNLTLLFGLHQAIACAEAGVTLVSPFVGRILDWYKKDTGKDYEGAEDPGVQSVTKIYNYFKKFGYKTQVMGASFRNVGEIKELAGSDLLTIAPKLLGELDSAKGELPRKLDPAKAKSADIQKIPMDEATFEKMHAADRMASDKLTEGINGFSDALVNLEKLIAERLTKLGEAQELAAARR
jgi:transaldolase